MNAELDFFLSFEGYISEVDEVSVYWWHWAGQESNMNVIPHNLPEVTLFSMLLVLDRKSVV